MLSPSFVILEQPIYPFSAGICITILVFWTFSILYDCSIPLCTSVLRPTLLDILVSLYRNKHIIFTWSHVCWIKNSHLIWTVHSINQQIFTEWLPCTRLSVEQWIYSGKLAGHGPCLTHELTVQQVTELIISLWHHVI